METSHRIYYESSARMTPIADETVNLVVTSPPYPMIAMWDRHFCALDPQVENALTAGLGVEAFEAMHRTLDPVWAEIRRILQPGGLVCIDIGDAVRTIRGSFGLYPNHARILSALVREGFTPLPSVLWHKPTNAPTKFMGSGMLPAGAYVTLEHETILVARKGAKRVFSTPAQRTRRRQSAYFWEERNRWFSDIWADLRGAGQAMKSDDGARTRSAAFPVEIPYRLVSMFSIKGDVVVDPFMGTGSTQLAAMAAGRHCIGFETDRSLAPAIDAAVRQLPTWAAARIEKRLQDHLSFVAEAQAAGRRFKHQNRHHGFPVVTAQETDLFLNPVRCVEPDGKDGHRVIYEDASGMGRYPVEAPSPGR
ncbi:MAG: site-specific DNA-methyltransferase [Desulfobacterales bacterium]